MSISVRCVITVSEHAYEGGSKDIQVFESFGSVASTGVFSDTPKYLLDKWVDGAIERAKQSAHEKLSVLKGNK